MRKQWMMLVFLTAFLFCVMSAGAVYLDVPEDHWAYADVGEAEAMGLMQGIGDGRFGLGMTLKRCEFTAMLARMFGWTPVSPETPTYADCDKTAWYYPELEAAIAAGAVAEESGRFRPVDPITREEIAAMLVRALGYASLAEDAAAFGHPFSDVTENEGFITVAHDLGIINGRGDGTFDPKGLAGREEAAAMMVRVNRKYKAGLDFLHGFYAFSSWEQRALVDGLDGLSVGWSRMEYSPDGGVALNTSAAGNNEWRIPAGFQSAAEYFAQAGKPVHLNVFMSAFTTASLPDGGAVRACDAILLDETNRTLAAEAIAAELARPYEEIGENPYAGVTIDFEGMKGQALKEGFTRFLEILAPRLHDMGKALFVAVHPATADGAYFDAYDYRAIGNLADKVILMAHDYQATSMSEAVMASGFTATPVTPFPSIYYALRAVTDGQTGVLEKDKIVLAVSFASCGWSLKDGAVVNGTPMKPTPDQIYGRLSRAETLMAYSERYKNPYITYYDETDDTENIVWYEDTRSVLDKIALARMFGVNGLSVWRIGLVPAYPDAGREIFYDVWPVIEEQRNR